MDPNQKIQLVWKSFQQGNKEAFATLYNQHLNSLYRYGTKLCADDDIVKDAIQEVFLDLYLTRKRNKSNPDNLKYYLLLALKRNIIKKLKKTRKQLDVPISDWHFEPQYSIEKEIEDKETRTTINLKVGQALERLPSKQKEAIYLRFNESFEYTEIATLLNISVESVRKQVYRAIKAIRKSFDK